MAKKVDTSNQGNWGNAPGWDLVGGGSSSSPTPSSSSGASGTSGNSSGNSGGSRWDDYGSAYDKRTGVDYSRNQSLAGQTVRQGMYDVYYDDMGYAGKAVKTGNSPGFIVDGVTYDGNGNYVSGVPSRSSDAGQAASQNVDYQALINQAVASGDYRNAGIYETLRNAKIASSDYKGSQTQTNNYVQYLLQTQQPQQAQIQQTIKPPDMSALQQQVDELMSYNMDQFKSSDQYGALKQQYANNGELSMNDLLGQVSSRTGGLASSYAAQAANQTYNDWMAKLEDAAQSMYQQNRSDQAQNLSALQGLYNNEYSQYQDQVNQYNADRSFNYQAGQDAIANQYQKDQWNYGMSQDEWNKTASQAETLAQYGDFTGYKALGYTDAQISSMQKQWQAEQAAAAAAKSAKKSSTQSSSNVSQNYDGLFAAAKDAVSPQNFISSSYKKYGFTSSSGLWSAYQKWAENGTASTSLNYSEDEGIFTWNGKQYQKMEDLSAAIDSAGLTSAQKQTLAKKFALYGFGVDLS